MALSPLDIAVVVLFFAINLGIGLWFARGSGKNIGEYFLSGRSAPWWLTGTSMVATTFAVDTPLAVTGFVAQNGIAGNWLWWNMAASGILTVFFFAALWRRSGVLTDVEFIELRYGGKPASALRGVRAVYQGVLVNTIIMGWVNLAMVKILSLTLHVPTLPALYLCLGLTALYVTIGGFWSILVTDFLQFIVKMTMAVVLAVAAVAAVGGIAALKRDLAGVDAEHLAHGGGSILAFIPSGDASWMPVTTFLVFIGVAWWASSYPGAEPGGGSYIAQRIFASRSEKDAVIATLFFNVAHYALRPWPWILVALAALVLYPHGVIGANGVPDPELGYVQTLVDHLPVALRGLMMAGFLAAYMSTIGTQLNLGASYLTNDLYRRFLVRDGSDKHYVVVSRWMTVLALVLAALLTLVMSSVGDAWKYMLTLTAGVGLVMILRWYWWRINAWSEISALVTSAIVGSWCYVSGVVAGDDPNATAKRLLITVAATTVVWLIVTFVTKPESEATLTRFYARVRPSGAGWGPIARLVPGGSEDNLGIALVDWVAGLGLVYGALFGIGRLVLGEVGQGLAWCALALVCGAVIARTLRASSAKAAVAALLALAFVAAPHRALADADKTLTNVKGSVTYERGERHGSLVPAASIALATADWTTTGDASQARVTLPDSSRVLIASDTRVQMARFEQSDVAHAQFIVDHGRVRFQVEHPQGPRADYVFTTTTANIAVRGTEGDIAVDGDQLTVNVYNTKAPDAPVEVTFTAGDKPGTVVKLFAGQSLVAKLVNGIIQSQVDKVTQAAMDQFAELGVPTSVEEFKGRAADEVKKRLPSIPGFPH
ncbi:MAG: FecR domain-containing protein [Candidatus Eremiobacteraeota bacterium]|nr:FecR domain-containing protein [Candidatus Eremiobacteraeota bacterium]